MPFLFPDHTKTRVVFSSSAEERFYKKCLTLSKNWRIYSSCTLSTKEGDSIKDNEIDFVCYHPKFGIIVVEVKGGRISYDKDADTWYSINRHNKSFKIKNPFQQVLVWKSRFLRFLKTQNVKIPMSHAVCFPSVNVDEIHKSAEVNTDIIIGQQKLEDLEDTLKHIATISQPSKFLDFPDNFKKLDEILAGSTFKTKLHLREYLDTHEVRLKDVESIQETLLTPLTSSHKLGIEGEAGTGKTMLAIMLAKHFRNEGDKVILLTSNKLLNVFLKKEVGTDVLITSYPELAESYGINLLKPPKDFEGKKEDWIQYEAPTKLKNAITSSTNKYNVMICDEAQDVQPFWWEAFEAILSNEEDRLYLFFDRSQGVFSSNEHNIEPEDMLPVPTPFFPLVHNYRTTREIASFSRAFRTGKHVLKSHSGRIGYLPEIITYKNIEEANELLEKLTKKLLNEEGLTTEEITILSGRNPAAKESILYKKDSVGGLKLAKLSIRKANLDELKKDKDSITTSTIIGFKGLETPVGILINIEEYNLPISNPIMSSLVYVACTRAKHMLYIFLKNGSAKHKACKKALQAINQHGSLVIDSANSDFEFIGEVIYYNQERVGWLKVSDKAFSQQEVMFFPFDIDKADIKDVKPGLKIKFRPLREGSITVAYDLKKV